MANPEYEAKVNPAELYNDEIISQFESIRSVIHKEILPSTYNELIVTSNQAGVLANSYPITFYPSTELIFPLSPQSGNINWLEKNFLRFKLNINDTNAPGFKLWDRPINNQAENMSSLSNGALFWGTQIGIIDGASIFKSVELNYGGTAIWTSAYQQVEAFFTFANIPDQLTAHSPQYWTSNKNKYEAISVSEVKSQTGSMNANGVPNGMQTYSSSISILIDIDISRLSPILAWMSLLPGFINKLTLRVILDAPINYLALKYSNSNSYLQYLGGGNVTNGTATIGQIENQPVNLVNFNQSSFRPPPNPGSKYYHNGGTPLGPNFQFITWNMELCEIHQCNATLTQDTQIRLINMIQQLGGKWIYPCRYWNTTLAPSVNCFYGNTQQFQFILTGCYFRSLSFTQILTPVLQAKNLDNLSPGNGFFEILPFTNLKIYCDSELIVSYDNQRQCITDTDSALVDNDKYTISRDIIRSLCNPETVFSFKRDCINKALGPPNGMYSGKYTSEKMGTHNIVVSITFPTLSQEYTVNSYLSALQDGVIVFDNFNGAYFTTGRKMQQVYEAMT